MGSGSSRPADAIANSASPQHDRLKGQVAIVTGPTSGIGYETARILAKHGAHVFLAARSISRAHECKDKLIKEIKADLPNAEPQFTVLPLDLGSLTSVKSAAEQFLETGLPLHQLINNAGIMTLNGIYSATKEGYESHVGTNHLGHFYFTRLLLPRLRASATAAAPAKIILVSSLLHNPSLKSVDEIENTFINAQDNYNDLQCYNRSKLYNIYHAQTLAANESGNNVLAFALHPGVIATNLSSTATGLKRFLLGLVSSFLSSPNAGAATTVHCAFREGSGNTGKYFANSAVDQPKSIAKDAKLRAKLMEVSEKLITQFEAKSTEADAQ